MAAVDGVVKPRVKLDDEGCSTSDRRFHDRTSSVKSASGGNPAIKDKILQVYRM